MEFILSYTILTNKYNSSWYLIICFNRIVWYYDKIRIQKLFDNFMIPDAVEDKVDYDVARKKKEPSNSVAHMFMVHFNFWCDIWSVKYLVKQVDNQKFSYFAVCRNKRIENQKNVLKNSLIFIFELNYGT